MNFETLSVSLQDHIATVRLNRPDKANAMNATMWQEIRKAFQSILTPSIAETRDSAESSVITIRSRTICTTGAVRALTCP